MGFNYSPKIVTDGLVLYLDAANSKSYPGSGTTWGDLSRGGNNGTLVNGPTFSSANGGSLVFNGTNQYASVLNTTGINFTLACWISTTATSLTGTNAWQGNGIIWSDVAGTASDFVLAILNNQISWFTGNPDSSLNGSTILNTGAWFYITAVKNGSGSSKQVYVNGESQGSTGAASGAGSTSAIAGTAGFAGNGTGTRLDAESQRSAACLRPLPRMWQPQALMQSRLTRAGRL
jgi:hypothetical protein